MIPKSGHRFSEKIMLQLRLPRRRGITPRDESRYPKTCPSIGEIRAVRRRHHSACRHHDRVSCRHVPFGGRSEPRIEVGGAFGDAAEFQRRAAGEFRYRRKALQELGTCGLEVRAADRRDTLAWPPAGSDRRPPGRRPIGDIDPLGAARAAAPDETQCRRPDDADDRNAVAHQRDIHGVFVAPGEELARPVERIDQEERGAGRFGPVRFLRDDRYAGKALGEAVQDHRLRGLIGERDRGLVGLVARADVAAVEPEDRRPGPKRDVGEKFGGPAVAREVRV